MQICTVYAFISAIELPRIPAYLPKFIQPKDGKINGNNMVFEFSGDDDVWVYIDGVLVLDIGGIHNSVSGSIDFAEGTVKVGSNNYTLKNLFKEAGAEKEGDFVSRKDIFKDYTVHTINFYYLERGKGDSNCKLKFNLPTVPDGSVKVQKQLSNTDKEKYADVKFKFQLLVKDEKENYVPSTPNGILDDGRKVEFSEDKVFTLKPGQYATFSGLKANTKYRIKELGVSKNEYDKVFINDEVTTSQDGNVISNEATVGSRPWVIFTNKCSEKNSRKLCITKKIKGDIPVNDKFDFEIKLNGQKYTGNYYLQDSEGNYYTSENGPLKKAKNKTVCGSAVNGVVSSVPAGYTVVLEQILAGTSFEVNEINLNPTDYGNPEYSIEAAEDVNTTDKASGKIELGSDAKVTVTNTRNNVASLEITRFKLTDDGLNDLATNSRLGTGKIKTNNDGSKEIIWTDSTTGSVVGKVTIVERGDGTTKITWKEQAARIGNAATENENDKGWNASFRIQAKDDFIGGNMIPTNGADSGIYLNGGGIKEFEQPSVNVKLLNLNIGSKKITVFKGDPITAKNFGNELAETIKVVQLNKKETLTAVEPMDAGKNSVKLPDLEDADIKKLNTDKELTIGSEGRYQYIYPGSKDAVGYFTYTYKIVRGNADEHLANSVGEKVEEYQLTVTYHPYSKEVRKQKLAKIKEPDEEVYTAENAPKPDLVEQPKGGISVDSSVASTGTYTVKVIAGELQIVKKLDAQAEKEETFRFTITDKNGDVATATAKIAKGGKEATAVFELVGEANAKLELDNKKLSELSRGDYVVKESSDNTSYELQSIVTGEGTNCDSAIAEDLSNGITFTMGTDKKQNKVPQNGNTTDGRVGIAEFTNKKTVVNIDFEKVDAETNTKKLSGAEFDLYKANTDGEQTGDPIKQYVSDKNGKVSIENLPIGNYVLVERKAPAGYQLSAKPWKIIVGSDRNITVTHGDDTVSPKGNEKIYQLTNAKLYSLPNSGGPGTYGFTISGVAILATALLLFINNKRREEEAKRS